MPNALRCPWTDCPAPWLRLMRAWLCRPSRVQAPKPARMGSPDMAAAHPDWIIPDWPAPPRVRALCTTRQGGVSSAPYDSLNLGLHVADDAAAVEVNRQRLAQAVGGRPVFWIRCTATPACTWRPVRQTGLKPMPATPHRRVRSAPSWWRTACLCFSRQRMAAGWRPHTRAGVVWRVLAGRACWRRL